jgi:hypothetical protein
MKYLLLIKLSILSAVVSAQSAGGDWDAYLMEVNGKPVSVVVDLGLARIAPMKDRPNAILVRTRIKDPDAGGQPGKAESARLDELENLMVEQLEKSTGAVYAGRFTQRGLREFHFFALDTVGYARALRTAFAGFTEYEWLARSVEDKSWSNYFDVLYPPAVEMEKIQNRRLVDLLREKGDGLKAPRRIDHYFYFKTKSLREQFLRGPGMSEFSIAEMPEADEKQALPYLLHLHKEDVPDYGLITRLIIPLWENARKLQGRYDGWETYLVK